MTAQLAFAPHNGVPLYRALPIDTDTSSAWDPIHDPVNSWGFRQRNALADDGQFTLLAPELEDPSIKEISSVGLTTPEMESYVSESLFDDGDEGLFEYDPVIRVLPKERFEVTLDVKVVRKADAPKLDPDWLI